MAMRGRGGRDNPNRPTRFIINRVYEQFKPMFEWRQEDDDEKLLVYLPGFQKEYIKVTIEGSNVVRVRGERLVSENKWSRFQEDYQVPESCEMKGIRAKFDGGILTITMRRKIASTPPPPATTSTAQVAPKRELPQEPKEEPKEKEADKPNRAEPPREPKEELKEKKPDKPKREEPPRELKKEPKEKKPDIPKREEPRREPEEEPKEKKPDKPQTTRLEDKTLPPQPKPASLSAPTIEQPTKPTPQAKEAMKHKHDVEKSSVGEKTDSPKGKGKEAVLKEEMKRDLEGTKGKPSEPGIVGGGLRGVLARRGMMTEDRKLLVNIGVGVLIIAALWAHVAYTIGLIGKGK